MSITKGQTETLTVTLKPDNADPFIDWYSDNKAVADVNYRGTVTAVSVGKTNIKAVSMADNSISATCEVTVTEPVTE